MRVYNFNEVVGNVSTVSVIRQSLHNGTFPHIAIFSGMHGTGKSTCAEIVSMSLTCSNTIDDNPCMSCAQCNNNLKALQNTGVSSRVSKVNVGRINKKSDMETLLKDIFDLQISEQSVVYIIEEAHALDDSQQTALLEEIDRLSSSVYIIFCTTKPTKLLRELRSRAITFNFTRLSNSEASTLFELYCTKRNITVTDNEIKEMILQYAKGIPRNIVNLIDFVCSNEFGTKTVADFLGIIDEDTFLLLFEAMKSSDMYTMISVLEDALSKNTQDTFIEQLKNFILRVLFFEEGSIVDGFNFSETERIHVIFDNHDVTRIASIIANIKYNASEAELKFKLLTVRQLLRDSNIGTVITDNKVNAIKQAKRATQISEEQENLVRRIEEPNLQPLDMDYLANI